jgi:hypothetical protein
MLYRAVPAASLRFMSPSLVRSSSNVAAIRRCSVAVEGVVQGVGFRPFVYRLAQSCRLVARPQLRGIADVFLGHDRPNEGGLALGQAAIAAARIGAGSA